MSKKILITGFSGFVARHFIEYMIKDELDVEIWGLDINPPTYLMEEYRKSINISFEIIDLLNQTQLKIFLDRVRPDYILHLASYSSVAYSWENPRLSFVNNTNIFLNLVQAVKESEIKCRILSVGSSEEYGNYRMEDLPLREDYSLNPSSPYAVARVSQEMLSKIFVKNFGMDIIMTRSFNHIGPWQDSRFVVAGFIEKVLEIKKSGQKFGEIEVGDLSIIRDFTDVRDVVRAYWLLLCDGKTGEVYNVCSGKGIKIKNILQIIGQNLKIEIIGRPVEKYMRPNDNKVVIGSNEKIFKELGWKPEIGLYTTINDMVKMKIDF